MFSQTTLKRIAAWTFLIIGFGILGNVLLGSKGVDGDYEKLFSIVVGAISTLIGVAKLCRPQKLSEVERKTINENYAKFNAGISMLYNNYKNSDKINEAKEILCEASNQANLELPKDLKSYVQKAYNLSIQLSLEVQKKPPNKYDELHNEVSKSFLGDEPYQRYSHYLTIRR